MKALSIRQPWAWLIATGEKDVENRTWNTSFRGRFLIHAAKTFDYAGYKWITTYMGLTRAMPEPSQFPRGGIVGSAEITGCVTHHESPWFWGPYGFVLKNARRLPFIPMAGKPGFFNVEEDFRKREDERLVGCVTQYDHASRKAEVKLSGVLCIGNKIHVRTLRSDWYQSVESMYVDGKPIAKARAGQHAWVGVVRRAYKDDELFVVLDLEPSSPVGPGPTSPINFPNDPNNPIVPNGPINDPNGSPANPSHPLTDHRDTGSGQRRKKRKSSKRGKRDDDDDDDDDEPDLPDPFRIDSHKKKKRGGEGG